MLTKVVQYEGDWTNYVHIGCSLCAAMSDDGKWIASSATHGQVIVRDSSSGEIQFRFNGHWNSVGWTSWARDNRRVISACADGTARVWSLDTNEQTALLDDHTSGVTACDFNFGGDKAVTGSWDGSIRLFDLATGQMLRQMSLASEGLVPVSISRQSSKGLWVVAARPTVQSEQGQPTPGVLLLLDETLTENSRTSIRVGQRLTIRWSPDETAFVCPEYLDLVIRDPLLLEKRRVSIAGEPYAADWDPSGKRIVVAKSDGSFQVYTSDLELSSDSVPAHTDIIWDVNWSHLGGRILTVSSDGSVALWSDEKGPALLRRMGQFSKGVSAVAQSPSGDRLISSVADGSFVVWDIEARKAALEKKLHSNWIRSIKWSRDGHRVITASQDGSIKVWRSPEFELEQELHTQIPGSGFWDAVWRDGNSVAAATDKGHIAVWDTRRGGLQASPEVLWIDDSLNNPTWVRGVDWVGSDIVACTMSGVVNHWNSQTNVRDYRRTMLSSAFDCAINQTRRCAAVALGDCTIRVLQLPNLDEMFALEGHSSEVWSVAFDGSGERLISASADGTVRVWHIDSAECLKEYSLETSCLSAVFGARERAYFGSSGAWSIDLNTSIPEHGARSMTLTDSPVGILDGPPPADLLNRSAFIEEMAYFLHRTSNQARREATRTGAMEGFLLHIGGRWGSGKTTIATEIMQRVRVPQLNLEPDSHLTEDPIRHWQVAYFSAWNASNQGPPWWAIAMAMKESILSNSSRWRRAVFRAKEFDYKFPRWWVYVAACLVSLQCGELAFGPLSSSITHLVKQTANHNGAPVSTEVIGLIASIVTLMIPISAVFAGVRAAIRRKRRLWMVRGGANLDGEQKLEDEWRSGSLPREYALWLRSQLQRDLLLVIDDLDRCHHDYVLEVVSAMQVTLRADFGKVAAEARRAKQRAKVTICGIVLSDRSWLETAIQDAMSRSGEEGSPWKSVGASFLEKVFLGSFDVPRLQGQMRRDFLHSTLRLGASPVQTHEQEYKPKRGDGIRPEGTVARLMVQIQHLAPGDDPLRTEIQEEIHQLDSANKDLMHGVLWEREHSEEYQGATETLLLEEFGSLMEPTPRGIKRALVAFWLNRALVQSISSGVSVTDSEIINWTVMTQRWPTIVRLLQEGESADAIVGRCRNIEERTEMSQLLKSSNASALLEILAA